MTRFRGYFWIAAAASAAADLLTKHFIFRLLPDLHSEPFRFLNGMLQIVHSENRGGVFGLGQGSTLWLIFGVAAGAAVIWFAFRKESSPVLIQIALGLVLGGAIGNVFDRVALGYVRDFIDVSWSGHHWPAFNVADSGICVGAVILALYAFFSKKPAEGKRSEPAQRR